MTNPTAAVVIDSREPQGVQAAVLAALSSLALAPLVTQLDSGDFVIRDSHPRPCVIGLERKKVSDLLGSFRSGRLDKQLARLRASYTYPILVVEGPVRMGQHKGVVTGRNHQTRWSHASVQMFLWSLQRREGIGVLQTYGVYETADLVRAIARRAVEGCAAHLDDLPRRLATGT